MALDTFLEDEHRDILGAWTLGMNRDACNSTNQNKPNVF